MRCEDYRVFRAGGVSVTNATFHFVEHAWPDDYLRYTGSFFKEVCSDIGFTEVYVDTQSASGFYYTLHQLAKGTFAAPHIEPASRRLGTEFHVGIMALLIMGQALDRDMVGEGASHWHSTLAVAVKGADYHPPPPRITRTLPFVAHHPNI